MEDAYAAKSFPSHFVSSFSLLIWEIKCNDEDNYSRHTLTLLGCMFSRTSKSWSIWGWMVAVSSPLSSPHRTLPICKFLVSQSGFPQ